MWTEVRESGGGGGSPSWGRKCKEMRPHYFRELSAGHVQLAGKGLSVWQTKRQPGRGGVCVWGGVR